jgi:hypothetical protein
MLRRTIIGWALALTLLGLPLSLLVVSRLAHEAPTSPVRGKVEEPVPHPDSAGSGNLTHDRLMSVPSTEQAVLLGKTVGSDCDGVFAFAMGSGRRDADKGDVYWSVRCADGRSYAVALHPGKPPDATVFGCDVVKSAGMECFKRLPR